MFASKIWMFQTHQDMNGRVADFEPGSVRIEMFHCFPPRYKCSSTPWYKWSTCFQVMNVPAPGYEWSSCWLWTELDPKTLLFLLRSLFQDLPSASWACLLVWEKIWTRFFPHNSETSFMYHQQKMELSKMLFLLRYPFRDLPCASWACLHCRVWRIYSNIRIFEYFWPEYLFGYSFVSFFGYEYIRISVRINLLDTNIFGYSLVARFWYECIQIFIHINFQIPTMFLFNFYGTYNLLMDILLKTMIKNAIWIVKELVQI